MKICIAGKNNIAVDCLNYILSYTHKENVCVILNRNDDCKNTWQKSLGFYAKKNNIDITSLDKVQEIEDLIFLSLEFDKIVKPERFKSKNLFNIHFSLLPEYKGMYTSLLPILHGKKYSGVTFHKIDRGIDTGDIIDQRKIDISNLNGQELYYEYLKEGTKLVCANLEKLYDGNFIVKKQSSFNSTYYDRFSVDFTKNDISVNLTAFQIHQFIKAFNFRAYQLPKFNGIEIRSSEITNNKSILKPGFIIDDDIEKFIISTIDYDLILYKDYYNLLMAYCKTDNIEAAKDIIDFVPQVDTIDKNGWTPLIVAAYYGSLNVVKLLIKKGANPNKTNLNGTTVLMYAKDSYLKSKDLSIIKSLIIAGADIYAKDIYDKTVFDYTNDSELINYIRND